MLVFGAIAASRQRQISGMTISIPSDTNAQDYEQRMIRQAVTLDDKYTEKSGRIYLTGLQALVRIPIMQRQLDFARGLKTAAFVSGYRGSPLGALDMAFDQAKKHLEQHEVRFHPGINEDLGATAVWGTQQLSLNKQALYDGVIGIWYGKGPGVDRSADVLKHANAAGTSKNGGVLALAGDDHACKSSTFPHQSEQALIHCMIPVLHPAGIEDALELGLHGIAMSRYSGAWSALKIVTDMADSSASVMTDPFGMTFRLPTDFEMPQGGLNLRWYDPPVAQEERLVKFKLPAAQAYARANHLDRAIWSPVKRRFGIVSTGKAYQDTRQALDDIGITPERAQELGIALYKVALTWPLEDHGIRDFAQGLDEILVVEEKRGVIEDQVKNILFHMPADRRPRVTGKTDDKGAPLLADIYELSPVEIAQALLRRLKTFTDTAAFEKRLEIFEHQAKRKKEVSPVARIPWYCSGCPHNSSTVVPEGSRALAGIGCHYMAMWMDRKTEMFTQMGGEGAPWIGQAPFTAEKHVFINLGDGTYFHSGLLAIRALVATPNINATYKILYNDAVAMTGGQHVDGQLTVEMIAQQVAAEGVKTIVVMSDYPEKYGRQANFPTGTRIEHRDDLDRVQKELRETKGISVLIYDQTCAAEKRRRRKRGLMEDPKKRVFINERVCEGCGDCSAKSNCLSVTPVETEFGKKRRIDQSSCNKDYSCTKGFCPSFVTVEGVELKKPATLGATPEIERLFKDMPEPVLPGLEKPLAILVTGIGGTGVVTIGALLAMAAHLENKGATTMDQTGLAQKGGAVTSHVRLAKSPDAIHTVRLGAAHADLIIGCDLLVTADGDAMSKMKKGDTKVVLNTHQSITGDFTRNPEWKMPVDALTAKVQDTCGEKNVSTLDATEIATRLLGNSIATNMFVLGYAWQKGEIPLSQEAIFRAIELNAASVKMNQSAFIWGRRAAHNLAAVEKLALPEGENELYPHRVKSETLDEMIARRVADLTQYQSASYARRYKALVDKARAAEEKLGPATPLTEAVARYYYKLMAYKDEYEVARLYTEGPFLKQVEAAFESGYRLNFHLAPPLLAKRDTDGHLKKMTFGPWVLNAFKVLAKLRPLRGTPLDIFGYTAERRMERRLIREYKKTVEDMLADLSARNLAFAVAVASVPEHIRGYGHVKEKHLAEAKQKEALLIEQFRNPSSAAHKKAA